MFRNRAAWINSRPGARWRSAGNPLSFLPYTAIVEGKYEASGRYTLYGRYNEPASSPSSIIATSADLKSWDVRIIAEYDIFDASFGAGVYFAVGQDFSGTGELVKKFDSLLAPLPAPPFSVTLADTRKVASVSLASGVGDGFIITSTTNYAYSDDDVGDSFTTTSYPSTALAGSYELKFISELQTYVDLRATLGPYTHRFSSQQGTFFSNIFSFTGLIINGMYAEYNPAAGHIYVIHSARNVSTGSATASIFIYNSSGIQQGSGSKALPNLNDVVVSTTFHTGTQKLYLLVATYNSSERRLYSLTITQPTPPFFNISSLVLEYTGTNIESIIVSDKGLIMVQSDGTLIISP